MKNALCLIMIGWLAFIGSASAYVVGPPLSLEKLVGESDIIFKATAISSAVVEDEWFKPVNGYEAWETEFKIVGVLKGENQGTALRFRHYDDSRKPPGFMVYQPQFYHFEAGRTYLVFARKSDLNQVFRQLSPYHTGKMDQGVLRCANDRAVTEATVKGALWSELMALLQSAAAEDVIYAIRQLDEMSDESGNFSATGDFERTEVLKVVQPLMTNDDPEIAIPAVAVIGSHNPYLSNERAEYWLATVGSSENPGLSKMNPEMKNPGAAIYGKELTAIANSTAPAATRALAIRSLGLSRAPALRAPLNRWIKDSKPSVRASAALLLADFPDPEASPQLHILAADPSPEVRIGAAYAIGFSQLAELADTLGTLLADPEPSVRRSASQSLLSFSPERPGITKVFKANLANEEFSPLFLNALAGANPLPYLDAITRAVARKTAPKNWSGGQVPCFTSWNILFKYLQSQPADDIRAGKFDRYLDALENGYVTGSSEPRDIYAFYLQRGMTGRAKNYRAAARKAANYDLDYYFDKVDQNPAQYTRQ